MSQHPEAVIVAGGFGTDTITTGTGEDLILGDNGLFDFTTTGGVTVLTEASTTDTTAATGAGDIIESGGGTVRHMVFDETRNEIWFGADTNTVGRAKLPE